MRLIVGGRSQGKLEYCRASCGGACVVMDGGSMPFPTEQAADGAEGKTVILDRLHSLIRRAMDAGRDPAAEVDAFLAAYPDADILCDEIGNGVVPIDDTERAWREAVGRMTVSLAKRADTVERVVCGLPQRIK